jgi:hypothetical protein
MIEVIAVLINFSVVCLIVWKAARKPTQDLFLNRKQNIEQQLREAEALFLKAPGEAAPRRCEKIGREVPPDGIGARSGGSGADSKRGTAGRPE